MADRIDRFLIIGHIPTCPLQMEGAIRDKLCKPSAAYLALGKWFVAYLLEYLEGLSTFRTLVFIDRHDVPPTKNVSKCQ